MMKTIALYIRTSKKQKVEAGESVLHQRELLEQYLRQSGLIRDAGVEIYQDEGWAGGSLDRPQFRRMFAGILLGRIQILITKDFSRLSRNHLWISHFREELLTQTGVRWISLGERYDSSQGTWQLGFGLRTVFHEYYLQDISQKTRQSLHARKLAGETAVARAPYGYRVERDGQGRCVMRPKPEEAEVVARLYAWQAQGLSYREIARKLAEESMHRMEEVRIWQILHNPVYTGRYFCEKTGSVYRGGFRTQKKEPESWLEIGVPPLPGLERSGKQKTVGIEGSKKTRRRQHVFARRLVCAGCHKGFAAREKGTLICRGCPAGSRCRVQEDEIWDVLRLASDELDFQPESLWLTGFVDKILAEPGHKIVIVWKFRRQNE